MNLHPVAVANEFVARYGANNDLRHMKLQKLLYFANGWHLGLAGTPLVSERPQVWRYGPVFQGVYNAFKRHKKEPIVELAAPNPFAPNDALRLSDENLQMALPIIEWTWSEYGNRNGIELSEETHAIGTPWRRIAAANNYSVPLGTYIPSEKDWEYFSEMAKKRGWNPAQQASQA